METAERVWRTLQLFSEWTSAIRDLTNVSVRSTWLTDSSLAHSYEHWSSLTDWYHQCSTRSKAPQKTLFSQAIIPLTPTSAICVQPVWHTAILIWQATVGANGLMLSDSQSFQRLIECCCVHTVIPCYQCLLSYDDNSYVDGSFRRNLLTFPLH